MQAGVQTFPTKQDEMEERARRRGRSGGVGGDVSSILDEIKKLEGMYDPAAKIWLLRDEDAVKKLAERHGYMLRWDTRRDHWWLDPGVTIVGPKQLTMKLKGDVKRFHGKWDGKNWNVPAKSLNQLRRFFDDQGVEYDFSESKQRAGEFGIITLKAIKTAPKGRGRGEKKTERAGDIYDMDKVMTLVNKVPRWPSAGLLWKPKRVDLENMDVDAFNQLLERLQKSATASKGEVMNAKQEKDVIRTLVKAGHETLAKSFARSRGYRVRAAK